MIAPEKVQEAARLLEKENCRFRRYLKDHVDEDRLDGQFYRLHRELFDTYDCSKCRNCCKVFYTVLCQEEIPPIAASLGVDNQEFIAKYLAEGSDGYRLSPPCPFLSPEGRCDIADCKPGECRNFPYTDQPGRLWSLYSTMSFAEVCPVVFEMLERLKDLYHFKRG